MGNQPSVPVPGTRFQVIGAGLPRTGTASFSEALRILLDGPVYHGGTQATLAPEVEILSWIKILAHYPPASPADRTLIQNTLHQRLDGYAAVTDSPSCGLVEELLECYPDALVICTTRDPKSWVKSMDSVVQVATMWFLRFVLFPLPTMRHFVDYAEGLRVQWNHMYRDVEPNTVRTYADHVAYLKRVVPKERLLFYDVKEGWGPLCKALGKPVPDMEYPRINDSKAIDELAKKMVTKGLLRWAGITALVAAAVVPALYMRS